jgi:flagellar biosynthesis/type III secretory pathway protein FliH
LRLQPDDAAAIAALAESPIPASVALVPDDTLGRGDCIVESDLGTIDARVATKLEALRTALRNA